MGTAFVESVMCGITQLCYQSNRGRIPPLQELILIHVYS